MNTAERSDQRIIGLAVFAALTLGLFFVYKSNLGLTTTSVAAVIVSIAAVASGLAIAIFASSLRWKIGGLACGLLAAVAGWWFTPTGSGFSLATARWESIRLADELKQTLGGETAAAAQKHATRAHLKSAFPIFAPFIDEAENDWAARMVSQVDREVSEKDPIAAIALLRKRMTELSAFPQDHPACVGFDQFARQAFVKNFQQIKKQTRELFRNEDFANLAPLVEALQNPRNARLMSLQTARDVDAYCQTANVVLEMERRSRVAKSE